MLTPRKGQSTIEYILVVTAVTVAILIFVIGAPSSRVPTPAPTGTPAPVGTPAPAPSTPPREFSGYQKKVNEMYSLGADGMAGAADRLFSSFANDIP
jgi:hypothetical protein